MQSQRTLELWVGIFVALGLAALFVLALRVSNLNDFTGQDGYEVIAEFQNIGGLRVRAPVTMAGVKVGQVKSIELDEQSFLARVVLSIDPRYDELPDDTSASILTSGLLGEQFIGLEPGGSPMFLEDGDEIMLTQSALVLEKIIGQFLYNMASGSGDSE